MKDQSTIIKQSIEKLSKQHRDTFSTEIPLWSAHGWWLDQVKQEMESLATKIREDERSKILARLSVEIMEVELHKNKDDYEDGHTHGVRRSIYLIKEQS